MMAVVESGGKQYQVSPGSVIEVERLAVKEGEEVVLDKVLMVRENDETLFGNPWLAEFKVIAEVIKQDRHNKIIVYKFKRRKGYHRKYGHRQDFTRLKIKEIQKVPGSA